MPDKVRHVAERVFSPPGLTVTDVTASAFADALRDRYRFERELGRGGMATVYLARDVKHDRDVALKVLRPALAAVLGAERFLREIRLTAQLDEELMVSGRSSPDSLVEIHNRRTTAHSLDP